MRHTPRITPTDPLRRLATCARAAGLVLAMAGALAHAAPESKSDALRGPKVADEPPPPGAPARFGEDGGAAMTARAGAVPHNVFMSAVNALRADDAPAELRLSPEQSREIDAAAANFRALQRAHMAEHKEEIERLSRIARPGSPAHLSPAAKPDPDAPKGDGAPNRRRGQVDALPVKPERQIDPAEVERARRRLAEIRAAGPRPEETHAAIWRILRPDQQNTVRARLEAHDAERMEQRAANEARRRIAEHEKREAQRPARRGAGARPAQNAPGKDAPAQPPQQRQKKESSAPAKTISPAPPRP